MLLKSLFDHNKIVAKGCLESASPDQYVGGRRLGSNWCAVQISVPMEWDEDLIRPYSNFSTIGDAIGTSVAWPCHLVISLFQLFLSSFIFICFPLYLLLSQKMLIGPWNSVTGRNTISIVDLLLFIHVYGE